MRLDRALVERGLARSRTHAQELIAAGHVLLDGAPCLRASTTVPDEADLTLAPDADTTYVSRAAHKLIGALDACTPLGLTVEGRRALDAGASTGGFTQVLLERGVTHVTAVDVGHDQLSPVIGTDPRVTSHEGVNVRELGPDSPGAGVDLIVADLSFISLTLVVEPLLAYAGERVDLLLMVKPQFEVGRQALGRGGVVRSTRDRADAVAKVVAHMRSAGLVIHHIARSPLPGPSGNEEFFVWGSRAWQASEAGPRPVLDDEAVVAAITQAVEGKR